jgi:hypothetical protein
MLRLQARVFRICGLGIGKLGLVDQASEVEVVDQQEMDHSHVSSLPFSREVVPHLLAEFDELRREAFLGFLPRFLKGDPLCGNLEVAQ